MWGEGRKKKEFNIHTLQNYEKERGRKSFKCIWKVLCPSLNWTKRISYSLSCPCWEDFYCSFWLWLIVNPETFSSINHPLSSMCTQNCLCDSLSGGTRTLWGHPDKLLWCGYRPVTWPVPSQPGVGHFISFLSVRGESVDTERQDFTINKYNTESELLPEPTKSPLCSYKKCRTEWNIEIIHLCFPVIQQIEISCKARDFFHKMHLLICHFS